MVIYILHHELSIGSHLYGTVDHFLSVKIILLMAWAGSAIQMHSYKFFRCCFLEIRNTKGVNSEVVETHLNQQ